MMIGAQKFFPSTKTNILKKSLVYQLTKIYNFVNSSAILGDFIEFSDVKQISFSLEKIYAKFSLKKILN